MMSEKVPNNSSENQVLHNKVINLSREGHRFLKSRQYAKARKAFNEGLEIEPDNPYLLTGMGDLLRAEKRYAECRECYLKVLEQDKHL